MSSDFEPIYPFYELNQVTVIPKFRNLCSQSNFDFFHSCPETTVCLEINNFTNFAELNLDYPTTRLRNAERFIFESVRIGQFSSFLFHTDITSLISPLLSLFATYACLFVHSSSPSCLHTESHVILACAFCDRSFPIDDILQHKLHSHTQFTFELLKDLSVFHATGCKGREIFKLLKEDETNYSVAESVHLASANLSSHRGTSINYYYYYFTFRLFVAEFCRFLVPNYVSQKSTSLTVSSPILKP